MVITLCGSSRFKNEIMEVAKQLTLQNHIVLMPMVFHHTDGDELTTEQKLSLDNLHKQKIDMSDAIFVVDVNGYIGESTWSELDWAQRHKKKVFFLSETLAQNNTENKEQVISTEEPKE